MGKYGLGADGQRFVDGGRLVRWRTTAVGADIDRHRAAFLKATTELLASKRCSAADFQAQGGWMKSALEHAKEPVYFIFCGGAMEENRVYLNVETGKILS